MTKKELLEAIKDMPEDAEVVIRHRFSTHEDYTEYSSSCFNMYIDKVAIDKIAIETYR